LCPFGPLFLSANVGPYNILLVLAKATLIHLLEVIRLEVMRWASNTTKTGKAAPRARAKHRRHKAGLDPRPTRKIGFARIAEEYSKTHGRRVAVLIKLPQHPRDHKPVPDVDEAAENAGFGRAAAVILFRRIMVAGTSCQFIGAIRPTGRCATSKSTRSASPPICGQARQAGAPLSRRRLPR